jgi:hypothetical protein
MAENHFILYPESLYAFNERHKSLVQTVTELSNMPDSCISLNKVKLLSKLLLLQILNTASKRLKL